jgi:hypothetical protein
MHSALQLAVCLALSLYLETQASERAKRKHIELGYAAGRRGCGSFGEVRWLGPAGRCGVVVARQATSTTRPVGVALARGAATCSGTVQVNGIQLFLSWYVRLWGELVD